MTSPITGDVSARLAAASGKLTLLERRVLTGAALPNLAAVHGILTAIEHALIAFEANMRGDAQAAAAELESSKASANLAAQEELQGEAMWQASNQPPQSLRLASTEHRSTGAGEGRIKVQIGLPIEGDGGRT
jgi:hypothetical protein